MTSLPAGPDDLTVGWLSQALGTEVVGVEVLEHAFATNQRVRIGLTYAEPGAGPDTLFAKLAPLDEAHRQMVGATGMGVREARFYADIAGSLDLLVPKCSFAAGDDELFVLLLEDLSTRNCRFSNGEWGVSADSAAAALDELARFHARFEEKSERNSLAPWLDAAANRPNSDGTAKLMRLVLDQRGESLPPAYVEIGELYVEHHDWFDQIWHGGPQTLIHGDTHIGNVFLDGTRVGFHDWGLTRVSTHLRDVSYFLTMSVDIEARRANERELITGYLDALAAAGGVTISFDDAWMAHRLQASYTVIATFLAYMPSYMSGDGVGLGDCLLARANAAIVDLDVVAAVRAAL